jgi:citrate lyase beta subunit
LTLRECLTYNRPVTASDLSSLRSLLFAPGSDERKLQKALALDADAVVADLEDAVSAAEKHAARELTARVLTESETRSARIVRINGVDTECWEDDVRAIESLDLDAVVLPKATPEAVAALGMDGPPVVAIVETAAGVRLAYELAAAPRVAALVVGAVDLGAELGLEPRRDGQEILYARSKVVVDSAAAAIRAPFDVVFVDVRDAAGLESEARLARSLGFGGKACVHPDQVGIVNRVFTPRADELEWARRVLGAYDEGRRQGQGVVGLNGVMVDLPVVKRAQRLLSQARGEPDEH